MRRHIIAARIAACCAGSPWSAQARVRDFIDTCMRDVDDFGRLPETLRAHGMTEVDNTKGPRGPSPLWNLPERCLWSDAPGARDQMDAYTGYVPLSGGGSFEGCWHVSRSREMADVALDMLKRRYPPLAGTDEMTTDWFTGITDQWQARVGSTLVVLGVRWVGPQPKRSIGFEYVIKLAPPHRLASVPS